MTIPEGAPFVSMVEAVQIVVGSEQAELVSDRLFGLGATAVSFTDREDGTVALVADVPLSLCGDLADALGSATMLEIEPVGIDPGWEAAWHRHGRTWSVGERLSIRPAWIDADPAPPAGDLVEVVIEPGLAFGSGSHVSTRLCLEAVERWVRDGDTVLDVGCGTGVLGVAALRLGAVTAVAIDIDPAAIEATAATAAANGVEGRLDVSRRPLDEVSGQFDLVVANLLVPIIEELGPGLARSTGAGGRLVLGGLLVSHRTRALEAVGIAEVHGSVDQLVLVDELLSDDWTTLVLARRR